MVKRLFVMKWRREPTLRRILSLGIVGTVIWGLLFGLLDRNIGTVGNWAYAVFTGCVFVLLMLTSGVSPSGHAPVRPRELVAHVLSPLWVDHHARGGRCSGGLRDPRPPPDRASRSTWT